MTPGIEPSTVVNKQSSLILSRAPNRRGVVNWMFDIGG